MTNLSAEMDSIVSDVANNYEPYREALEQFIEAARLKSVESLISLEDALLAILHEDVAKTAFNRYLDLTRKLKMNQCSPEERFEMTTTCLGLASLILGEAKQHYEIICPECGRTVIG